MILSAVAAHSDNSTDMYKTDASIDAFINAFIDATVLKNKKRLEVSS